MTNISAQQSESYESLIEAVANGAMLFVGAGSSCKAGYPTWGELLDNLREAACRVNAQASDFDNADGLIRASKYRKLIGTQQYEDILTQLFGLKTPSHHKVHETLVGIPFTHVLTTNYDNVLEAAHWAHYRSEPTTFDVDQLDLLSAFRTSHVVKSSRRYVHVHGSIARPKSIVLCQEDYDERYVRSTIAKDFLKELFVGQRVVFLGFSLEDEDLKYVLREVCGGLELSEPHHFAILPKPQSHADVKGRQLTLREKHSIEPVFFDNSKGDFSGLWQLVDAIRQDVEALRKSRPSQQPVMALASVPQLIDELLPSMVHGTHIVREQLKSVLPKYTLPLVEAQDASDHKNDIDKQIDALFALVVHGLPDAAIREYEAIRTKNASALTLRQQYRIEANIGNAHYSKGDTDRAATSFLEATKNYRATKESLGIELLGTFLKGDHAKTLELAEHLCTAEPNMARGWSILVQCQTTGSSFDNIEKRIPEAMRSDAEVALALSDFARRNGDLDAALRYARAAAVSVPEWPIAQATLGVVILASERRFAVPHLSLGLAPANVDIIKEAERAFTSAIDGTPASDPANRLPALFYDRSLARRLLGQFEESDKDLREAFRRQPLDPLIAVGFSIEAATTGDFDMAINTLDRLSTSKDRGDEVAFARALLRWKRKRDDDISVASEILLGMCKRLNTVQPLALRSDIAGLVLNAHLHLNRPQLGLNVIQAIPDDALKLIDKLVVLGRAYFLTGDVDGARQLVNRACDAVESSTTCIEKRQIAILAFDCGLYGDAVKLFQSIPITDSYPESLFLAQAAYLADDWKLVLATCEQVRRSGTLTIDYIELELDILLKTREPDKALSLIQEWVEAHPGDRRAALNMSIVALNVGRSDLGIYDETLLPLVKDIKSANRAAAVVHVLRHGPNATRAFEVAYEAYRKFPSDASTQLALIGCVFDQTATPLQIERPTKVGPNTAVFVRKTGELARWIYVEPGTDVSLSNDEFPEAHDFVRQMWGRSGGDNFKFQDHAYEIVAVDNRMLRRVHEIMERFEISFPQLKVFRRFNVPVNPPPDASIEERLGEMYPELKRHESRRELLEGMYLENKLPLSSLAQLLGRPVFDVVRYLAAQPLMSIRADEGNPETWLEAMKTLHGVSHVVLDGTALACAVLFDLLDDIPSLGFKPIIPRAVLDEVRRLSLDASNQSSPGGTIGMYQGSVFIEEHSPQAAARQVEMCEKVIRFIRDHCEVVGGEAVLDLPTELRSQFGTLVDPTAFDAFAIASKTGYPLWTDDLGMRQFIAAMSLRVNCVWTQAVLRFGADRQRVSSTRHISALSSMLESGYVFTRISADDIVGILQQANWRLESSAGRALVRTIVQSALLSSQNRDIVALGLLRIWVKCPKRSTAKRLVISILDGIGREQSKEFLAAYMYRPSLISFLRRPSQSTIVRAVGLIRETPRPHIIMARLSEWRQPDSRSLKHFLRSWRSRDGEFKPAKKTSLSS